MPGYPARSFAPSRYQVEAKESTDPARLEALSHRKSSFVRSAVAANPHTSTETLTRLAESEDDWVRRAVATNENAPASVLDSLAADPIHHVRKAVGRNRNTAADVLGVLGEDLVAEVRCSAAWNHATPPEALRLLAGDRDENVRKAVARNPGTPAEVLPELARDSLAMVRSTVAGRNFNPDAPTRVVTGRRFNGRRTESYATTRRVETGGRFAPELIREFSRSSDERLQFRAASQPDAPEDVLLYLAESPKELTRRIIAENQGASPRVLRVLVRHREAEVLKIVAVHPNADDEVLTGLALSGLPTAQFVLATQREGGLAWMAAHPDPQVRKVAARHMGRALDDARAVEDLALRLLADADGDVQVAAAESAPLRVVDRQAGHDSQRVRRVVAQRTSSVEVLALLAGDAKVPVRRAVAKNPRVPASVLPALVADRDERTREAAAARFLAALG